MTAGDQQKWYHEVGINVLSAVLGAAVLAIGTVSVLSLGGSGDAEHPPAARATITAVRTVTTSPKIRPPSAVQSASTLASTRPLAPPTPRPAVQPTSATPASFAVPLQTFTGHTNVVKVGGAMVTFHGGLAPGSNGYQIDQTTCTTVSIEAGLKDDSGTDDSGAFLIYTASGAHRFLVPKGRVVTATYTLSDPGSILLQATLQRYIYIDASFTCSTPNGK